MKILIVEDSIKMREMIRSTLKDTAIEFVECADGVEAVKAYTRHRPDWVLMDIAMEEMDGITATKRIRTDFPEAKIVMVTHYDDPPLRDAAEKAGASGFVSKDNLLAIRDFLRET